MRKKCAFCRRDDRKISKEHILPTWMKSCLPRPGSVRIVTSDIRKGGYTQRKWVAHDTLGATINDICKPCNEGWLERLESSFRTFGCNLIGGKPAALTPREITVLASWAYKTHMVYDLRNPRESRSFFPAQLRAFHDSPVATLQGLAVFAGAYDGEQAATFAGHLPGIYWLKNGKPMRFTVATFSVGCLVLQVLTYDHHALPPPGIWIPHLYPGFENTFPRIWPLIEHLGLGVIQWPPGNRLTTRDLITLRDTKSSAGSIVRAPVTPGQF